VLSHARRQHRWIRGDWQILFWLFPWVPSQHGIKRNTLPIIGRWKILDNLRRSLVSPTLLALLVAGWTVLPGPRWFWTMTVMGVAASQLLPVIAQLLVGPVRAQSISVFLRNLRRDVITALAQVVLSLTFLAFHAYDTAHAIVLTLVRLSSPSGGCSSGKRRRPPPRGRRVSLASDCGGSWPRWWPARSSPER
jgi:cyclic beta-1,2-glucan synthetase